MSTNVTWPLGTTTPTPTSYSIPASGEINWASLSTFLIALGQSAQGTSFQRFAIRKAIATPVTVSATTDCVVVTDLTTPGAVTVNLPAGINKQIFFISDGKGDAFTYNVTINRAGSDTIQGSTSYVMTFNRQSVLLAFNSSDTDWKVIAATATPALTNPMTGIGDMIYGSTAGAPARLAPSTSGYVLSTNGVGSAPTFVAKLTDPMTTQGDTIFRGPSATNRLAAGNLGQMLTTQGAGENPFWSTPRPLNPMTTQGDMIYGSTSGVEARLAAGTSGYVLSTTGSGTPPVWVTKLTDPLTTQGDIMYRNSSASTRLAAGTSGYVLATGGSGANPSWVAATPLTTIGDMMYATTSGVPTRLPAGTQGDILMTLGATGGSPTWSSVLQGDKTILGNSDEVQLTVAGHSTQTTRIIEATRSDATEMWSISNSGSNRTYLRTTDANGAVAASSSVNDEVYLFRGGHWNGSTNAACGLINIERSRGATINSNTILQSGDFVGKIKFMANDGTGSVEAATIHCKVDGTPGFGDMPGALYFSTTPDGNQFVQEAGRITNGGAWYIGDGRGSFPGHRIYGTNNGTAPTAGCVGEVIETVLTNGYWEQNSPGAAGWYDVTSLSMTLTAGHWMITFFGVIQGQQSSSGAAIMVPYVGIRTGSTVLISSQAGFQAYPGGYFIITAPVNLETRVNISSSTTYKISMGYGDYTGTPCTPTAIRMRYDWGSQFLYSETTFIRGVRIS